MTRSTSWVVRILASALPLGAWVLSPSDCRAEPFGGVEFPLGARSFADSVVRYDLHDSTDVVAPYVDPKTALGPPDYTPSDDEKGYVCLGNAPTDGTPSELVLRFDDNALIDVPGDDLYVFEIGPEVEATEVAVSPDGKTWYDLGRIAGSTRGVDLSVFSSIPKVEMRFVRLRDYPDGSTSPSPYGGPDIDAVGAIGSVAALPLDGGTGGGAVADAGGDAAATPGDASSSGGESGDGAAGATGTSGAGGTTGGATGGGANGGANGSGANGGASGSTGTGASGATAESDASASSCPQDVREVTRCECGVPGRVHGTAAAPLLAAAGVLFAAGRRRRRRRPVTGAAAPASPPTS
jgi:hypothetical protein